MIVYTGTKKTFSNDVVGNEIVDKVLACLKGSVGHFVGEGEVRAFQHSLLYMNNVLLDKGIPNDSGVSIEYQIPQTGKRIDFIISGLDERSSSTAILIELKQWSHVKEIDDEDNFIETFTGGASGAGSGAGWGGGIDSGAGFKAAAGTGGLGSGSGSGFGTGLGSGGSAGVGSGTDGGPGVVSGILTPGASGAGSGVGGGLGGGIDSDTGSTATAGTGGLGSGIGSGFGVDSGFG